MVETDLVPSTETKREVRGVGGDNYRYVVGLTRRLLSPVLYTIGSGLKSY